MKIENYRSFAIKITDNEDYFVWIVTRLDGSTLEHGEADTEIEALEEAKGEIDNFYEN